MIPSVKLHPRDEECHSVKCALLTAIAILFSSTVSAQQLLKVSQSAWVGLTTTERELIQKTHVVQLAESNTFGVIVDNQAVNESTPGTTGGAYLGAAVGNAAYIDNALKSGNYSAKSQLASGILGAVIGSSLDRNALAQFHFRYAVRLGSGDVQYFDQVKGDAFRHPVGVCVSVPSLTLSDQQVCTQTSAMLRLAYLQVPADFVSSSGSDLPSSSIRHPASSDATAVGAIQIGDTVWASNGAINGYRAPSISAKCIKKLADGAPLEVVVIMKEFFRVRDANGLLFWVERRGVVAAAPSMAQPVPRKPSVPQIPRQSPPPPHLGNALSTNGDSSLVQVNCKLGTLAPVLTSAEKCELINGSQVQ